MAVSVSVRDLDNYPGISKTITVNLSQLVPVGEDADEKWIISNTTSAYSDNTNRTAIQDIYIRNINRGWIKSSGLVSGPFTINSSNNQLKINIDNVTTGTYTITLASGVSLSGDDIAADIELKIRALADTGGGQEGSLNYKGASAEFVDGKFYIYSGTVGKSYTATTRTSVVLESATNDARATLGFDMSISSYWLSSNATITVSSTATAGPGAGVIEVNSGLGITGSGYACTITDGTGREFFVTNSGTTETNLWPINSITGTYATGSKVALLNEGDPDYPVSSSLKSVDDAVRWALEAIIEQIDFSS